MNKRRVKIFLLVLLTPVVLLLAFLVAERFRGQIALARYKRELIAKGEKLSPRDFVAPSRGQENAAPEIYAAITRLKEGAILPYLHPPPVMRLTPAGHAIVGFHESQWAEGRRTYHWEELAADLKSNEVTLEQIRAGLEKPVLYNDLDLSEALKGPILQLSASKTLMYWFAPASQLALHDGRNPEALKMLLAQARVQRLLTEDRIMISELVRIGIAAFALPTTWEALQAEGWTDEDLGKLQDAWASQEFAVAMTRSSESEMIMAENWFEMLRASNDDAYRVVCTWGKGDPAVIYSRELVERQLHESLLTRWARDFTDVLMKQVYCRVWRFAWVDQDECHRLKIVQRVRSLARAAAAAKSAAVVRSAMAQYQTELSQQTFYDRLRYSEPDTLLGMSRAVERAMHAETERSIVICAIALKRYSVRHGKPPPSLESLVPEFLAAVPVDYMDGKPMKYHLNPDGTFTLYSVGEDGNDDGGDAGMPPDKTVARWMWQRKDFVWPAAASPEEIEAFRKESAKN